MEKLKTCSGHDNDDDGIDRISELPEDVIHRIMKFLHKAEDATRISILSKKFFSIWCSFSALDFDFCYSQNLNKFKVWDTDYVLNSIHFRVQHRRLCKNNKNSCLQRLRFAAPLHGGFEPRQ
ncbi:hypothetical protein FNV43_RR09009 [Rhamnella rubrinervis]|uniref:F-box domain-containing protein n=1 Tax=Rhamnella rubrinervis TaxID=2594499 RepID=A0A8K0MJF9_9ROSA|nr:hypothetical protein FNV43_RR09009 [Rhamnella rubrinervis]